MSKKFPNLFELDSYDEYESKRASKIDVDCSVVPFLPRLELCKLLHTKMRGNDWVFLLGCLFSRRRLEKI